MFVICAAKVVSSQVVSTRLTTLPSFYPFVLSCRAVTLQETLSVGSLLAGVALTAARRTGKTEPPTQGVLLHFRSQTSR